jgi:cytochrome c peroxidase
LSGQPPVRVPRAAACPEPTTARAGARVAARALSRTRALAQALNLALALALALAATAASAGAGTVLDFSPAERQAILAHGPWPSPAAPDPSNRAEGLAAAQALGRQLFFDPALSAGGTVSCASCHRPAQGFQDGRAMAQGRAAGSRNTPALWDLAAARWFGWDGAADSLWAASLRPLTDPREMGDGFAGAAAALQATPERRRWRAEAFGESPVDDEAAAVQAAKALAAWLATRVSPRTAFDDFRDALARGDRSAAARYPLAAQRGLRLFVGEGRCNLCHTGPRFTHGEFADAGVPFFLAGGGVDSGRHGGILALRASRYSRIGPFSDAGAGQDAAAALTRHLSLEPRHFGEFKVPGLRQLRHSAPYMHAGSLPSLAAVVRHYSELDPERVHADGQALLRPLRLDARQAADLEAFLETLSTPGR